ncbi:CAP domain-containing protein [Pimelobacter sp. 30-1]|uniref:CAP domain-containing protein n=1 Tax=Pimelobacter sp. 30-1 TaxID=2004991 RepID=UPI001C04BED2|nr:CAP domain-containing protein [Pimelobacter sp. 30-1]
MTITGRISGTRAVAVALLLALTTGVLVGIAAPGRAAADPACTPSATVTTVKGVSWLVSSYPQRLRFKVRKAGRTYKVRATATVHVSTTGTYKVTGVVDRCTDGASAPEPVTLTMRPATSRSTAKSAVAKNRKVTRAKKAARKTAVTSARIEGRTLTIRALDAGARANAQRELSKLLGAQVDKAAVRAAVFAEVNARRAGEGLAPMKYLAAAEPLADDWAEQTKDGPFEHDTDPVAGFRADLGGLGCNPPLDGFSPGYSENLHWGSNGTPSEIATWVVNWWMNSPGHRATLLSPFDVWAGIGLAYSTESETWAVAYRATSADCSNIAG